MAPPESALIDPAALLALVAGRLSDPALGVGAGITVLLPREGDRFGAEDAQGSGRCVHIVSLATDDEERFLGAATAQDAGAAVVCTLTACVSPADSRLDDGALEAVLARVRAAFRPDLALLRDASGGHTLAVYRVTVQTDPADDPDGLRTGAVRLEGHAFRAEPQSQPLMTAGPGPANWET